MKLPLKCYTDDDYRENYMKSATWDRTAVNSQLGPEDMAKLRKMLRDKELKEISEKSNAQDILNWSGSKR